MSKHNKKNLRKDQRNILEKLNSYGFFAILPFLINIFPFYSWLKKSYSKALGFNNIIIKPQISAVFFSIVFYGGMILYWILMIKCKPRKELEESKKICIIECISFADFLVLIMIYAISRQANLNITNDIFKIIVFVFKLMLNIGVYLLFKIYELLKSKTLIKNKITKIFLIIELLNVILSILFFESAYYTIFIYVGAVVPIAWIAISLCIFKDNIEEDTKASNKIKVKFIDYRKSFSNYILFVAIFVIAVFFFVNDFNNNFLGKGIARSQYSFVKIEASKYIADCNKADGYLLFETDNNKYISVGYKTKENHYIKLMHDYRYVDIKNMEVSERYFMIDLN